MADRDLNIIIRAVDKLSGPAGQMDDKLQGLTVRASQAADMLGRRMVIGAAAAGAALAGAALTAARYGDELAKASDKTGVAVEDLARLRYAAEQSGVSFGQLEGAMARMARTAADASRGTGDAALAYQALGINVMDASGQLRGGQELFTEIAQRLSEIQSPSERAAQAMRIFGRSGAELLPLLNMGAAGIDELSERAEKLGLVMDEESARAAERFNDALNDLKLGLRSTVVAVGETMFGTAEFNEKLAETIGSVSTWIRENSTLVRGIVYATGAISGLVGMTYAASKAFGLARETIGMVRTILAWYTARVVANKAAIDAETVALERNTAAQTANSAAAGRAGGARAVGGAGRAIGAVTRGPGAAAAFAAGGPLAKLGAAAAGAAVPLAIIAASAVAIALWKRNIDVAVDTQRQYNDAMKTANETQEMLGKEALDTSVQLRDLGELVKLILRGPVGWAQIPGMRKRRAVEEAAGEAITPEEARAALGRMGETPRQKALREGREAQQRPTVSAPALAATLPAVAAGQMAAPAPAAVAAATEGAMSVWQSMDTHLARIADAVVGSGGRMRAATVGAGTTGGPVHVSLNLDGRVIAQHVIDMERRMQYGYPQR